MTQILIIKMTICLVTQHELTQILARKLVIPLTTRTLVFTLCSPYEHPVYDDTKERLVVPQVERVIFWRNEKYFQDKWVYRSVFPSAKEMWISHVCGGFFDFGRPKLRYVVPHQEAEYRGFPPDLTDMSMNQEQWSEAVHRETGLPTDLHDKWGGSLNKRYCGPVNVFFDPVTMPSGGCSVL
jgi:hypothetical protein